MRQIGMDELKKIQLEILDAVSAFCTKHGITYWLDGGTLIGTVRHKGYIPWDDDIDLGMLRPDYDRFIKEFNAHNSRYRLVCRENDPDFYQAFAKVMAAALLVAKFFSESFVELVAASRFSFGLV